jgi:hypothetical protein
MPGLDFAELRRRISMRRVLTLLDYRPTTCRGDPWRGPCPLCGPASTPPALPARYFTIHLGRHVFRCYRCGASGNQLDLWRLATSLPLYAAALDLCTRLHEPPPQLHS